MSDKYFAKQINLKAEEELIVVLHHHPITYAKQITIALVLILGAFFLMFALFSLGELGVALFCALILTGVIYGCREFYVWFANACVITSHRLVDIDQQAIFQKTVSDIEYSKIIDISYSVKGISQTIFNIGSIRVKSQGANLLLKNIREPGKINQLLVDLIREQTGKQMEVKKVSSLGSRTKDKMMDDFINQDELAEYEEYNLNELIEEYKETFGELSFKKLLVTELEAEEDENDGEDQEEETSFKEQKETSKPIPALKTVEDEIKSNFKKKRL